MYSATSTGSASWRDLSARFSRKTRLVQFISDLVYADAASSDCMEFHNLFRRWGFEAAVYAGRRDSHHERIARDFSEYRPQDKDLIIFHYSAWSPVAQFLLDLGRPIMLVYHNITPPEFFGRAHPQATSVVTKGIEALPQFAPLSPLAVGMSEFSRHQLQEADFQRTEVMPILVDFQRLDGEPNQDILSAYNDDYVNLLFVGRVDPNKRQEDIIKTLYYYQRHCNSRSRLFLVGAHNPGGPYHAWLSALADHLGVAADVHFTGQTSHRDLLSYFHLADTFLCMSEHEGFCVPIVESMYLGIPVVAYHSTAIPFTMGDAGVLIKKKDFAAIAEVVHLLNSDQRLRAQAVAGGRKRAQYFGRERVEPLLADYIGGVLKDA